MRQKRAKAYKRLMNLYAQNFGFRSPFQVLGELYEPILKKESTTRSPF